jgi:radical SAM protein
MHPAATMIDVEQIAHEHGARSEHSRFDDRPLLVFWEMTTACALACAHCRANAQLVASSDQLTTEEGFELIEELAALGAPRPILILTGGDCMMRSDLLEILTFARSSNVPVAIAPSVTQRLSSAAMSRLHESGVATASLSLDGALSRTHDSIRGIPGHFQETLSALDRLRAHDIKVQINTTVMTRNVHELADVAALMVQHGVSFWEVFFLINTGRGSQVGALNARDNEDICHFLVDASRYGFTVRTVEAPFFRRVLAERAALGDEDPEQRFALGALYAELRDRLHEGLGEAQLAVRAPSVATRDGKGVVFVAHNGDIYPSGFLPLCVGNVLDEGLIGPYRDHPVMRDIRAGLFQGACGTCQYRDLCGGSRARAFAFNGDPLGADPGCVLCEPSPSGVAYERVLTPRLR